MLGLLKIRLSILILCLNGIPFTVRADQIDDLVTAQMQEQHIPGLSLAVIRDGKISKVKGYGFTNVELNVAASPESVYHLASLTKQFTAAAIMLLVQDGKVDLDARISRYLGTLTPDNWRDINVRQ